MRRQLHYKMTAPLSLYPVFVLSDAFQIPLSAPASPSSTSCYTGSQDILHSDYIGYKCCLHNYALPAVHRHPHIRLLP